MSLRSTNKVLLLIILVLLVTNIIMLFLLVSHPRNKKKPDTRPSGESSMVSILRDSVGFSEKQIAEYNQIRTAERPVLKDYFKRLRQNKERFYNLVSTPEADNISISLADSIAMLQKNIDLHFRNHFLKVRDICTSDQLQAYDQTIAKIAARMAGGRQGPRNKNDNEKR